jgi:hypothetical protein
MSRHGVVRSVMASSSAVRLRWLGVLGGAVVLVMLVVVGRAWADLQRQTSGLVMTTSPSGSAALAIPDLATLTRLADLVVVGHIASDGATRLLVQPAQTPIPFQPVAPPAGLSSEKAAELARQAPPPPRPAAADQSAAGAAAPAIPITAYPVQVERVARGSSAAGQQITVLQTGGTIGVPVVPGGPSVTRTLQVEDDTLMRAGERYVLFLQRTPDGTYAIVGGPQGRLGVDAGGKVHPLQPGAPATRGRDGQALETFVADVAALR